jgi:uncharacterized Fe-S cluster protein YjdI
VRQEKNMRKEYYGHDITVSFDLDVCTHSANCLRGDPAVFELGRRPWILPDAGDAEHVAEVINTCPSGALRYKFTDEYLTAHPDAAVAIAPWLPGDEQLAEARAAAVAFGD